MVSYKLKRILTFLPLYTAFLILRSSSIKTIICKKHTRSINTDTSMNFYALKKFKKKNADILIMFFFTSYSCFYLRKFHLKERPIEQYIINILFKD